MKYYIPIRIATFIAIVIAVVIHDGLSTTCAADKAAAIEYLKSNGVFARIKRNDDGEVVAVSARCTYGLWDDPQAYGKKWLPEFAEHLRALPKLKEVVITDWVYSDGDMRHLAGIPQLSEFTNSRNFGTAEPFTGSGLKHLVMPAALRVLHLAGGGITDESLEHVGRHRKLVHLRLSSSNITDAGLEHLKPLDLVFLSIRYAKITGEGFSHLAHMRQMRALTLDNNKIRQGLKHFTAMRELRYLDLLDNDLKDADMAFLQSLTKLETVKLAGNNVSAKGVAQYLKKAKSLTRLDLSSDHVITGEALQRLIENTEP